MRGLYLTERFLFIDFFLPKGYKIKNYQNPETNNCSAKMRITEERLSMNDENK